MGRRRFLDPATKRNNNAQCYLTTAEFEKVCRTALKQDLHISAWMRKIVLREVEKKEAGA
jgi:hypothetical protein